VREPLGDNRDYHGDLDGPADYGALLPHFVVRVLVAGDNIEDVACSLAGHARLAVYGYSPAGGSTPSAPRLEASIDSGGEHFPLPPDYLDAVVAVSTPERPDELLARVRPTLPALHVNGVLLGLIPDGDLPQLDAALARDGWHVHSLWTSETAGGQYATIFSARHDAFSPFAHAAQLAAKGRPDWAYDVLYLLPERYAPDSAARVDAARLSLSCLRAIPPAGDVPLRLARFARAQWLFSCAAPYLPAAKRPWDDFAAICEDTWQGELAARLRNTASHLRGEAIAREAAPTPAATTPIEAIAPTGPAPLRRVLFLLREQMDYGLDVLYDGLCDVLGEENVTDFPHKPSLHQEHIDTAVEYYPCAFSRPGKRATHGEVREALRRGAYDLILFGDFEHDLDRAQVRDLLGANPHIPVALVDQGDTPCDHVADVCAFLGIADSLACFKRERLRGVAYHPRTMPLPFAYPAARIPDWHEGVRDVPLSWAGNRETWVRTAYVAALEELCAKSFDRRLRQGDYSCELGRARIAPCFFGAGFDTVRYWEVPAHGALLLAERPPIAIENNFLDGVHAVFFDDLPDLEEKAGHFLAHPEHCAEIARAGHGHLKQFHTGAARAAFLLKATAMEIARNSRR